MLRPPDIELLLREIDGQAPLSTSALLVKKKVSEIVAVHR
jgi:hypothetical protein